LSEVKKVAKKLFFTDKQQTRSLKDDKRANTGGAPSGLVIGIIGAIVGVICFVAVVCAVVLFK
jgi:hypothetical protein